jgi:hypothetical protein
MAYIGNQPTDNFVTFATQNFSTSATSSYTLSHAVSNENEIALFINNVRQHPGSGKAYTATGTALTLSANTASTDVMYCIFLGRAIQSTVPATNSITAAMVSANAVTGAKLNTDVISAQTALTSSPADTDELLISDAGTLKRIDVSLVGGKNTPAFMAKQTGTQNINNTTWTKVQFNAEVFDTDGTYDHSSNYRWTPGVAGKYFMYLGITIDDLDDGKRLFTKVYKNGSGVAESLTLSSSGVTEKSSNNTSFIDVADADDYYEAYVYHDIGSAEDIRTDYQSIFMGYKIIE